MTLRNRHIKEWFKNGCLATRGQHGTLQNQARCKSGKESVVTHGLYPGNSQKVLRYAGLSRKSWPRDGGLATCCKNGCHPDVRGKRGVGQKMFARPVARQARTPNWGECCREFEWRAIVHMSGRLSIWEGGFEKRGPSFRNRSRVFGHFQRETGGERWAAEIQISASGRLPPVSDDVPTRNDVHYPEPDVGAFRLQPPAREPEEGDLTEAQRRGGRHRKVPLTS
jgi:hypothetical protein